MALIEIGVTALALEDRIEFFRTLSSWLTSGGGAFPLVEAVANTCDAFSRDEYRSLRGRMEHITREFSSGQTPLYRSLKSANLGFTEQEIAIIKAAEQSNQLREAVPSLVEALSMRHKSVSGLKRQLAMPIIGGFMLILMSLGVMIFMLPVVMGPVIAKNPDSLTEFPLIIRAYWGASVWLRNNYTLTAIVVSMPVWMFLFRNTRTLSPIIEKGLMGTSAIRRIILSFNGVMIVYFMPTLVRSGMTMPQVLLALASSLKTTEVVVALKRAAYDHEHGRKLGDALASVPLRGSFRTAVEAGEKTGKIADRVEDLKIPYVSEFERIVRKAVALLMITVMAGLLPFFIISMYTSLVAPMIALMEYS